MERDGVSDLVNLMLGVMFEGNDVVLVELPCAGIHQFIRQPHVLSVERGQHQAADDQR